MHFGTFSYIFFAALLTNAVVRPAMASYGKWKRNPERVQVAGRDWRGRYVPDLKIKRVERSMWIALAALFALGLAIDLMIEIG